MFTTRGAATERADTVPDFLFAVGCIRSATSMTRCCCSLLDPREARSRPFACVSRAHPWRSPCIPGCRTLRGHPDCVPACRRDCCGPDHVLSVFVGVRVDSAAFRSRGEFALELVPADQTGQTLVTDAWTISATLVSPVAGGLPLTSTG